MCETRLIMGMPITVEIVGGDVRAGLEAVFDFFTSVDERFSTYKEGSEISRINRGEVSEAEYSTAMREVFALAAKTKEESGGYFDIMRPDGSIDPSGIVKGWAIAKAAALLREHGIDDFMIDAGGDIQTSGTNSRGEPWSIGVRSPFNREEIVKVLYPQGAGIATSGTATRGQHIYNPHAPGAVLEEVASITVLGPDILEADRFATAAFAMGARGLEFIESLPGFEGYEISTGGRARLTSGLPRYYAA